MPGNLTAVYASPRRDITELFVEVQFPEKPRLVLFLGRQNFSARLPYSTLLFHWFLKTVMVCRLDGQKSKPYDRLATAWRIDKISWMITMQFVSCALVI